MKSENTEIKDFPCIEGVTLFCDGRKRKECSIKWNRGYRTYEFLFQI